MGDLFNGLHGCVELGGDDVGVERRLIVAAEEADGGVQPGAAFVAQPAGVAMTFPA